MFVYTGIPIEFKYVVFDHSYVENGVTVFEFGKVYEIHKNAVKAENGVFYIVDAIPVPKMKFENYPENYFTVYYKSEDVIEELKKISISISKPALLDDVVFIKTKDAGIKEIVEIKGVTKVRYQRNGRLASIEF